MGENHVTGRVDDLGDAALLTATGKTWNEWFEVLDTAGAVGWSHPQIARWVTEKHSVDGWWAQGVTVGYEQARGIRRPGQMADGTFSVGSSRVLPLGQLAALDRAVEVLARELGGPPASTNRAAKFVTARWALPHGEGLLAQINPPTGSKCSVVLTHSRMASADSMAPARARLRGWLETIAAGGSDRADG